MSIKLVGYKNMAHTQPHIAQILVISDNTSPRNNFAVTPSIT